MAGSYGTELELVRTLQPSWMWVVRDMSGRGGQHCDLRLRVRYFNLLRVIRWLTSPISNAQTPNYVPGVLRHDDYEQHEGMTPLSDENRYGKPPTADLQVMVLAVLYPHVVIRHACRCLLCVLFCYVTNVPCCCADNLIYDSTFSAGPIPR